MSFNGSYHLPQINRSTSNVQYLYMHMLSVSWTFMASQAGYIGSSKAHDLTSGFLGFMTINYGALFYLCHSYSESVLHDWIDSESVLHNWIDSESVLHDWIDSESVLHNWIDSESVLRDWIDSESVLHDWTDRVIPHTKTVNVSYRMHYEFTESFGLILCDVH